MEQQRKMPKDNIFTCTKIMKIFMHYTRLSSGIYLTRSYQFKLGQGNKLTYKSTGILYPSKQIRKSSSVRWNPEKGDIYFDNATLPCCVGISYRLHAMGVFSNAILSNIDQRIPRCVTRLILNKMCRQRERRT